MRICYTFLIIQSSVVLLLRQTLLTEMQHLCAPIINPEVYLPYFLEHMFSQRDRTNIFDCVVTDGSHDDDEEWERISIFLVFNFHWMNRPRWRNALMKTGSDRYCRSRRETAQSKGSQWSEAMNRREITFRSSSTGTVST